MLAIHPGEPSYIGAYRVVGTLDSAAANEVLLAMLEGPFGEETAFVIKRARRGVDVDASAVRSLARETQAYARLSHPSVLKVHEVLALDDGPAMVLELVDGMSLAEVLDALRPRGERLAPAAALHVAACLFSALAAAHAARDPRTRAAAPIVHRDVNPGNVLLTRAGGVKLADFGSARVVGGEPDTRSGRARGTWGYMAPEQLLDAPVTVRTDVYSAALVARELLTGERAFARRTPSYIDWLESMAAPKLTPIADACPELPAEVSAALERALAPNSIDRSITAEEMHLLLRAQVDEREGARALVGVIDRLDPVRSSRVTVPPGASREAFERGPVQDEDILVEALDVG